jgi:hypothetical protein
VLAHASGQWVSSEWPVCRIGDIASPPTHGCRADLCPSLCPFHADQGSLARTISTHLILGRPSIRKLAVHLSPTADPSQDDVLLRAMRRVLVVARNTLTPADADVIEPAFRAKLHFVERVGADKATTLAFSADQRDKFDPPSRRKVAI